MQKSVLAGPFPSSPLVTNAELLASGLTHSAICKRVQRGVLFRRYPGVYSHGPGDLSRERLAAGTNDYLVKPVSLAHFADALARLRPQAAAPEGGRS